MVVRKSYINVDHNQNHDKQFVMEPVTQLPTDPITGRLLVFQNVMSYWNGTIWVSTGVIPATVVVEALVGITQVVTGTAEAVTGIVDGSTEIISDAFYNRRVNVFRGNVPLMSLDPADGSNFMTKVLSENKITLNNALSSGESIRIETII